MAKAAELLDSNQVSFISQRLKQKLQKHIWLQIQTKKITIPSIESQFRPLSSANKYLFKFYDTDKMEFI